mgnify:CR=1 FL=1
MYIKLLSFSLLFLLKISSCECDYSGKVYFVKWDLNKKDYVPTNVEIGTIEQSFNIEDCKNEKDSLFVKAIVYSRNQIRLNKKNEQFYLIGIQKNKNLDTLYSFSNYSINNYVFDLRKYESFVFKEKESEVGHMYFTKGFKKYFKW